MSLQNIREISLDAFFLWIIPHIWHIYMIHICSGDFPAAVSVPSCHSFLRDFWQISHYDHIKDMDTTLENFRTFQYVFTLMHGIFDNCVQICTHVEILKMYSGRIQDANEWALFSHSILNESACLLLFPMIVFLQEFCKHTQYLTVLKRGRMRNILTPPSNQPCKYNNHIFLHRMHSMSRHVSAMDDCVSMHLTSNGFWNWWWHHHADSLHNITCLFLFTESFYYYYCFWTY
jgi:hypothetical protein